MDVRIGIAESARELTLELDDSIAADSVKAAVESAVAAGHAMVWLTDKRGKESGFPANRLAYIEIGNSNSEPRIGFGAP